MYALYTDLTIAEYTQISFFKIENCNSLFTSDVYFFGLLSNNNKKNYDMTNISYIFT